MASLLKHKLGLALAALVLAAAAGGAYAATSSHTGPAAPRQAFLRDVASRLHVTPQALRSAIRGAFFDRLSAAVAAGRLTKAQAAAIEQAVKRSGHIPLVPLLGFGGVGGHLRFRAFGGRLQGVPVLPGPPGLPGPGPLLRPGPGALPPLPGFGFFGWLGFGLHGAAKAATAYLGITRAQLLSDLRAGRSLAQVAASRGKSVSGLKAAIEGAFKRRLDRMVGRGRITRTQESRILSRIDSVLPEVIKHPLPLAPMLLRPARPFGPRGFRRGASSGLPAPPSSVGAWSGQGA
jgi:hypothetical protein